MFIGRPESDRRASSLLELRMVEVATGECTSTDQSSRIDLRRRCCASKQRKLKGRYQPTSAHSKSSYREALVDETRCQELLGNKEDGKKGATTERTSG